MGTSSVRPGPPLCGRRGYTAPRTRERKGLESNPMMRVGGRASSPHPPGWRWLLAAFAFAVLAAAGPAEGGPSMLRVATCQGTYPPFVQRDTYGRLTGLEVEMFQAVYGIMMRQVRAINASEVLDIIGDAPPVIGEIPGFAENGVTYLRNGTIDIYFCGAYMTVDRCEDLDFGPPTIASGYTMVVSARDARATWQDVQTKAFGKPNALGIYTIVVMIFMNLAFAHCVWACERRYNGDIRPIYGPGIYDAFWLGFITATTVGYGDKTPKTVFGRIVTIFWMLTGTYLMGLFAASITSGFITQQLLEIKEQAPLSKASDLMGLSRRVGAAFPKAGDALRRDAPGVVIRDFTNPRSAYRALYLGMIDVLVDDTTMAVYTVANDPEFRNLFTLQGAQFGQVDYGFLLSMPGGRSHPIYTHFYRAVFEYLSGESRLVASSRMQKWFGENKVVVPRTFSEVMAEMLTQVNVQMAWVIFGWVIVWCTATYITRPSPDTKELMDKAIVRALRLEDFEFNRHVVKRAAEELFVKIDVDDSKTIDIPELVNALRLYSNFDHPDVPFLFAAECRRILSLDIGKGTYSMDLATPRRSAGEQGTQQQPPTGFFARASESLGFGADLGGQLDKHVVGISSELDRIGGVVKQRSSAVIKNTAEAAASAVSSPRAGLAATFGRASSGGLSPAAAAREQRRIAAETAGIQLTIDEFTQVIMHIVLEGSSSTSQSDTSVAKQHHVLHVHDEIRRQLDVMDYKAKMIEWLLEGGGTNDARAGPPPVPHGTPSGALKRAKSNELPISRVERLQFMENRWRQAVGEEPIAAGAHIAAPTAPGGGGGGYGEGPPPPTFAGAPPGTDGGSGYHNGSGGGGGGIGADLEVSLQRLRGWRNQDSVGGGGGAMQPVAGGGSQNQMC